VQTALDALGSGHSDAVEAPRYATYAWATLAAILGVIVWGAFVRATGSGAGCGSHWPLCNGEVVPRSPTAATLIELGHRLTSGLAALLAGDASIARAWWVSGHLVNTFLLVAALTLAAWGATHGARPRLSGSGTLGARLAAALGAVLVVGVSGAITALGDTLFPAATVAEGEAQTFSDTAHLFVRLRVWHPLLALAAGVLVLFAAQHATRVRRGPAVSRAANLVLGLLVLQIGVGVANVSFLAPVPLQLVHLLLADLMWIALVVLAATALAAPPSR